MARRMTATAKAFPPYPVPLSAGPVEQRRYTLLRKAGKRKVDAAVKAGKMVRGIFCEKCGSTRCINAHHEDYGRPLDVVWLCAICHGRRHGAINRAWWKAHRQ